MPPTAESLAHQAVELNQLEDAFAKDEELKTRKTGESYWVRARMRLAMLDVQGAMPILEEGAKAFPENVRLLKSLGRAYLLKGDIGKAGGYSQRAARLAKEEGEQPDNSVLSLAQMMSRHKTGRARKFEDGSAAAAATRIISVVREGKLVELVRYHLDRGWLGERKHANADAGAEELQALLTQLEEYANSKLVAAEPVSLGRKVDDDVFVVPVRLLWQARIPSESQVGKEPWQKLSPAARLAEVHARLSDERKQIMKASAEAAPVLIANRVELVMVKNNDESGDAGGNDWIVADLRLPAGAGGADGQSLIRKLRPISDLAHEIRGPSKKFRERYGRDAPAEGQSYRYRQIIFALSIMGLMALFVRWLIRRAKQN